MPHQCTDCGRQFDDGSKEMLSGCPECGGNKFQFLPASQSADTPPEPPGEGVAGDSDTDRSVARTVGNAATAVKDFVGGSSEPTRERPESAAPGSSTADETSPSSSTREGPSTASSTASTDREIGSGQQSSRQPGQSPTESEPAAATMADTEDEAQASARSEVISPDELPSSTETEPRWPGEKPAAADAGETDDTAESERPDLSELRAELNQQFESIKVLEPGQYELNLMELFDREEYIVALQEDGKYTVQVPEDWKE
ncbi:OapC/ArvC family zinc-ribbon domain-containing protein [Halobacteriaceae archaeon SHR40]|uniref:OapC/ArvC family zinc-ribbon domain-containing protein n=1 Tax=Halovenus amylolytica TaxID=2500550 RepID=UPI000FE34CC5